MSDIPRLIFDGSDALTHLRSVERCAPLHMRPEHDAESLKAWLRDRREEIPAHIRHRFETAIGGLERGIGELKTLHMAKAGELRAVK